MTTADFLPGPWQRHPTYDNSVFSIQPAPEYATAEVMVASLYRASGFDVSENVVPSLGRKFDKAPAPRVADPAGVSEATWRTILHGVLSSPKQPNQSSKRFMQLSPLVPDVAAYSGSARLAGNSWNPGELVRATIVHGSESQRAATELWSRIHDALSVSTDDDIWARWLQQEFSRRRLPEVGEWHRSGADIGEDRRDGAIALRPARQFVSDLRAILATKPFMTRRQWLTLLEAILRIGTVAHVLSLCHANDVLWRSLRATLEGEFSEADIDLTPARIAASELHLSYGRAAVPRIRDVASRYLTARLGINLTLWQMGEAGEHDLSTSDGIKALLRHLAAERATVASKIRGEFERTRDDEARTIACKKGIGSNVVEFARHTLGQRQTAVESLRGYDQGYVLRKNGQHHAAPWVVSLGPVAVIALVHCCLSEVKGPRSVQRLRHHLEAYGISVERADISRSDLGRKLRMLGLVLDSPDAESGMLLIPPFQLLGSAGSQE